MFKPEDSERHYPVLSKLESMDNQRQAPQPGDESQLPPDSFDDNIPDVQRSSHQYKQPVQGEEIPWADEQPAPRAFDEPF